MHTRRRAHPTPLPATDEIEIVLSDRVEDVGEVLSVVHDGFVEAGFTPPQPSGKRLHPSYLNPGTVFALARIDGEPVGAAVVVVDGPFGLPSDRAFAEENDALRASAPIRSTSADRSWCWLSGGATRGGSSCAPSRR